MPVESTSASVDCKREDGRLHALEAAVSRERTHRAGPSMSVLGETSISQSGTDCLFAATTASCPHRGRLSSRVAQNSSRQRLTAVHACSSLRTFSPYHGEPASCVPQVAANTTPPVSPNQPCQSLCGALEVPAGWRRTKSTSDTMELEGFCRELLGGHALQAEV